MRIRDFESLQKLGNQISLQFFYLMTIENGNGIENSEHMLKNFPMIFSTNLVDFTFNSGGDGFKESEIDKICSGSKTRKEPEAYK